MCAYISIFDNPKIIFQLSQGLKPRMFYPCSSIKQVHTEIFSVLCATPLTNIIGHRLRCLIITMICSIIGATTTSNTTANNP